MIVYFADRKLNILGQASTGLPKGLTIVDDKKSEDVETGVAVFDCEFDFDDDTRAKVEECVMVGNYILRKNDGDNEFYTIIDSEVNVNKKTALIYAEDAGLDLLNEVVGAYEADKAYPIDHYVEKFAYDSGFVIGINEASGLTRKLSWDGEATVTARLASVATQFDNCEISFSFDIKNLQITSKKINIYKKRGKDIGTTLHLNKEIDNIVIKKTIANVATALRATGGTPEKAEDPITLRGYTYDDGDFYVDGDCLKSREALKKWSRYINPTEANLKEGHEGHIVRTFSYETTSQAELCSHTLTELKKIRDMEVNYEADVLEWPENTRIGDRVNIVDEKGELFLSARILQLEDSVVRQEKKAVFGEYLIKSSGISQKVIDLAHQFAQNSHSAARALAIAQNANEAAQAAQSQADTALADAEKAAHAATEAATAANTATQSAQQAQQKADAAQAAVDVVEESVAGLETTVTNAQAKADSAQQAAATAQSKADEAATAAAQAIADAADANAAVVVAQSEAAAATTKAEAAQSTADTAKAEAETAQATADAAKQDAANAQSDINALGENLTTLSNTMSADYARKTDLTEATANLQTQITQNAAEISSTASRVQTIDETANNAQAQAQAAQSAASAAQSTADQATADAQAAQNAADQAAAAASSAQSEADKAKAAAATAQSAADKAEADLEEAKADLASVTGRVGATEEEIAAAQQAVTAAQAAADKANTDAAAAAKKAEDAQSTADTAVTNAATAQTAANEAADKADTAQRAADAAKGDAAAAQATANEAKANAATAQATANTAKTNAATAQAKADQAAADAATAQKAADDADAKAAQAASDLATAQQNLANVTNRVGATEEEIAAAQAAVEAAQAAADKAEEDAAKAQSTADTAKANAATAQTAANNAKTAADNAQAAADEAQQAADNAQAAVDALAVRVTTAETKITQTSEQIALMATKTEVTETLGGYYTKEEADAAIKVSADSVKTTVSNTYATKTALASTDTKAANAATAAANAQTAADDAQSTADDAASAAATAQSTANTAKTNAATAQSTADTAKSDAATAQTTANNAATAAANAQTAADNAQDDVDALAVRVTSAETAIDQNAESITLRATKTELNAVSTAASNAQSTADTAKTNAATAQSTADAAKTAAATAQSTADGVKSDLANNYYTKTQTNSQIQVASDSITSTVEAKYQQTVSKGEQLVLNGNGMLGNNTNFSAWTFDGAVTNNSPGSFTRTGGRATIATNEFFLVNPQNEYTLSFDVKSLKGAGTLYAYLDFYDVDKIQIGAGTHLHNAASTTTLAQDLKKGDTVIYLTDASGWSTSFSYGFYMTVWNYTNSFGYTYPAGTYSKNRITLPKTSANKLDSSKINYTNNTLTLASAYTGSTIPAGTSVSQGGDGATYKYIAAVNKVVPKEWVSLSGTVKGVDLSGTNAGGKFPPGTAYAKVGFLWNYNSSSGEQIWVTNVTVSDTTPISELSTRITQTENSITSQASSISSLGTKVSTLEQNANGFSVRLDTVEADAIVSTVEQFYQSSSATALSGGSWSNSQPTWTAGKYIWRRTLVTYGDGSTAYTPSSTGVCITGNTGAQGAKGDKGDTGATGAAGAKGDKGDKGDTGATGATGAAGRGIKSTAITYQASSSGTTVPTGTWSSSIPSLSAGQYLWTRTVITYTDSTTSTSYSVGMKGATGAQGATGSTGAAGRGVKSTAITYQASTSGTTVPTGTWSSSVPSVAAGSFLWTRTIITYTDNTTSTSYSVGKMGNTGAQGAKGDKGDKGDTGATGPQGAKGDKGDTGAQGAQGYSIVASVARPAFTEANWTTYGTVGHEENWSNTSDIRNGCRIGDIFTVVGTATDTKNAHVLYYRSDNASGNLRGVCISHSIAERGATGATGAKGADGKMLYATCGTAAGTAAKVATLSSGTLTLSAGATVAVKFTYANTASSPTLNVSSTGAKSIRLNGAALTSSAYYWVAGGVVTFVYDGTYWNVADASALAKANEAAKTASNFMSYDSTNGLLVGNKSSGSWSGYRAQVKSDSFNILDASGNQLSSFGANKIELGKNNDDAEISLCNGHGTIRYEAQDLIEDSYLQFGSYSMDLVSTRYSGISARADYLHNSTSGTTDGYAAAGCAMWADDTSRPQATLFAEKSDDDESGIASAIFLTPDGIAVDSSDGVIRLTAPTVTTEGDHGITGHFYDNLGLPIRNGLCAYESSGIDPNTTVEHLILTNVNVPSATFYYVLTFFYSTKSASANRGQLAFPYSADGAIHFRYYYNGKWSAWRKPLYGGEETEFGKIELYRSTPYIDFHHGNSTADFTQRIITSSGGLLFYGTTSNYVAVMSDRFRSSGNDVHYLGDSSNKWKAVYSVNGTIQTSDRTQKKNIEPINDRYVALFDKLQPVSFEFADAESDRVHLGYISQDVKEAMDEVGLTDLDFAGYCRDIKKETVEVEDPETGDISQEEKDVLDANGNPAYSYSLRYSEFIALNSKMIQLNRQKIAEQEAEIQSLRDELAELKEAVKNIVGGDFNGQ